MTEQEQRIAIAEACGWKRRSDLDWKTIPNVQHEAWSDGKTVVDVKTLPDYLHDLNAVHEAEKRITLNQIGLFESELHRLSLTDYEAGKSPSGLWPVWHSTAKQRAEAFLRAIGKWKD